MSGHTQDWVTTSQEVMKGRKPFQLPCRVPTFLGRWLSSLSAWNQQGKMHSLIGTLTSFALGPGFNRTEAILNLSDVWPCKRNRWWCILSAPAIGPIHFQALPKMFDLPSIRHVLPEFQKWRVSEEQQLMLSAIELEAFAKESGSATKYLPNMKGLMPCALHAWGAQLVACPCGCPE